MKKISTQMKRFQESLQFLLSHPAYRSSPFQAWLRVFSWYALVALGKTPVKTVPSWGLQVLLPSRFKTPAKVFYVFGEDYDETLSFLDSILPFEGAFLDVGANFGIYSLLAAKKNPDQEVHAFDPIPEMCELLKHNVHNIERPHLKVHQVGVSDSVGRATLHLHRDNGRSSLRNLKQEESGTIEIEITTLDECLVNDLDISVMKLDVEGYECKVLRGAQQLLEKHHPLILFENNPGALRESGDSPEELQEILKTSEYQIYSEGEGQQLVPSVPKGFGNFIAIHPSNIPMLKGKWTLQHAESLQRS
jgi:FkbM family methyltransferase